MKPTYQGTALETGGTSMNFRGAIAPALRWLYEQGYIEPGMKVLDFGAGKYDRNAIVLRKLGVDVWSYDPFHGSMYNDGWSGVSPVIEEDAYFDLVFTSFVLNVVPDNVENAILKTCERFSPIQYHIVRADLYKYVQNALQRVEKTITDFWSHEYGKAFKFSEDAVRDFCYFGTKTSRGFQRIPQLEEKDFEVIRHTKNGYTIYTK